MKLNYNKKNSKTKQTNKKKIFEANNSNTNHKHSLLLTTTTNNNLSISTNIKKTPTSHPLLHLKLTYKQ